VTSTHWYGCSTQTSCCALTSAPAGPPAVIRGVQAVAKLARAPRGALLYPALVNGTPER